jgi:hypothetical protein
MREQVRFICFRILNHRFHRRLKKYPILALIAARVHPVQRNRSQRPRPPFLSLY